MSVGLLRQLHDRLGIDVGTTVPGRKAAGSRLRRVMSKHRMTENDVQLVIDFASRHHKLVRVIEGLPYLLNDARREKAKDVVAATVDVERDLADAVAQERALYGDTQWTGRLIRAQGKAREQVLADWRRERGQ